MLANLLIDHLWMTLSLWSCLYVADYYLTLAGARLYAGGVQRVIVFEGSYELNPFFQADIDRRRRLSYRFIAMLAATCLLLAFAWRGVRLHWFQPGVFRFYLGALLLIELAILMRHLRNIATFRQILAIPGIAGQLRYPRWWTLRSSAIDLWLFAGLYALLASAADPWFFLGGALACGAVGRRHFRASRHARAGAVQADREAQATQG